MTWTCLATIFLMGVMTGLVLCVLLIAAALGGAQW
jgi:hypothetical protein